MCKAEDKPIFVISCGRTGSTLLQRLLNTHPEIHIWGEHGGGVTHLCKVYESFVSSEAEKLIQQTPDHCKISLLSSEPVFETNNWSIQWINGFSNYNVIEASRDFLQTLFASGIKPTAKHWGFKEIRYGLPEVMFLKKIFEQAKFLILIRDPIEILSSQLEYFYSDKIKTNGTIDHEKVLNQCIFAIGSIERLDFFFKPPFFDYCHTVRFEDIKNNALETMNNIASFCDLESFSKIKIDAIIKEKKSIQKPPDTLYIKNWIEKQLEMQSPLGRRLFSLRERLNY